MAFRVFRATGCHELHSIDLFSHRILPIMVHVLWNQYSVVIPRFAYHDLRPSLLVRFERREIFDDLRKRVHLELFFWILVELVINIGTDGIRIDFSRAWRRARNVAFSSPIGTKRRIYIRIILKLRCIILYFDELDLWVLGIQGSFNYISVIFPTPNIKMYISAETCDLE